jgi:NitT/TauT family transport system permease protein
MNRSVSLILPILGAASILLVWQFLIPVLGVPPFIVPTPAKVLFKLGADAGLLAANTLPTAIESIAGFAIGNLVAILLAVVFVYSRAVRAAYFPVVLFFNTIPILALAPIIVLIFGLGMLPKIVIAAVICFFPTLVNMIRGLEMPSRSEFELFRILSASPFETFWRLRVPRSLPLLFTSLKIASTTCVIGAIVGEWIGANQGLGALIIQSTFNYQTDRLYAAVFTSSFLGLAFFGIVALAERLVMRRRAG